MWLDSSCTSTMLLNDTIADHLPSTGRQYCLLLAPYWASCRRGQVIPTACLAKVRRVWMWTKKLTQPSLIVTLQFISWLRRCCCLPSSLSWSNSSIVMIVGNSLLGICLELLPQLCLLELRQGWENFWLEDKGSRNLNVFSGIRDSK